MRQFSACVFLSMIGCSTEVKGTTDTAFTDSDIPTDPTPDTDTTDTETTDTGSPVDTGPTDTGGTTVADYDLDNDGFDDVAFGGTDCDDSDATIHPGAPDVPYDGIDHACDGLEDDLDGDGFLLVDDCNDLDATIFPGAPDIPYDGIDHACDGLEDDLDGDGFDLVDDCDDLDADFHPGAPDLPYDGIDHACDGLEDDLDGDGFLLVDDCNDVDATVFPGAPDVPYDGIDHACDGLEDDLDGDGFLLVDDCDDLDADVFPGAPDVPYDGIDFACDGLEDDLDGDGYDLVDDCDDLNPAVNPGVFDVPYDGVDADCSGNDDFDADADGHVSDAFGGDDCDDGDASVNPDATEVLDDGIDQDCSGIDLVGPVKVLADLTTGNMVITEIMHDSLAVVDLDGEWFEIWNSTVDSYNLNGLKLQGASPAEAFTVDIDLLVEPGGFVLFARHSDPLENGLMNGVDFEYDRAIEFSTSDQLSITKGFGFIDLVTIGPAGITSPAGQAVSLDPDHFSSVDNGVKENWCPAVDVYGAGDMGTPGQMNPECP